MSPPTGPIFDPHDAWEALVRRGVPKAEATQHVLRLVANQPEAVQQEYLKDVDPGALASFGLGAADMASFGLGDKISRLIWGKEASNTQQSAIQEHPAAHVLGEVAGAAGPAAAEYGLAKAGMLTVGALGRLVGKIANKPARIAAKTALNAAMGAGYGAAQGAGRASSVSEAIQQGKQGALWGGLLGGTIPLVAQAAGEAVSPLTRYFGRVGDRIAGPGPAVGGQVPLKFDLLPAEPTPPASVTNTPPILSRAPVLPSGGLLDQPTFQRQAVSPLEQTAAEQGTTAGAKAIRAQQRVAARNAYNIVKSAGGTEEQAKAAAQRAASAVGLLAP